MLDLTTIQRHVAKIEADGYSIVENAIEPDFVDALVADLGRLERELDVVPAKNRFEGTKTVRIYNLLIYGKLYERIPVHEHILPIVERVLDPGCLVSSLSSIAICNDEKPQPLHADDQLIPIPRPHVPLVCNTMWALTDFTEANGATRVIPGSNHWEDKLRPTLQDTIPALMRRGSVLFYTGSLYHGGGANSTGSVRMGINLTYCRSFLRQEENQYLACPPEVARTLDEGLLRLMGYGRGAYALGYVGDLHDPLDVLFGREAKASSSLAV